MKKLRKILKNKLKKYFKIKKLDVAYLRDETILIEPKPFTKKHFWVMLEKEEGIYSLYIGANGKRLNKHLPDNGLEIKNLTKKLLKSKEIIRLIASWLLLNNNKKNF